MGLKLTRLDLDEAKGVLDGAISFTMTRTSEGLTASIPGWKYVFPKRHPESKQAMRSSVYEAIARYRESQRVAQ